MKIPILCLFQESQLSEELSKERNKAEELRQKLDRLHKQFKKQSEIASERITKANKKLKEFFRTIEVIIGIIIA